MRRSPTAPTPPAPPGATALKLWIVLARAFDAVDRHSRASIARFGLGTTEFGVLEVLYHKGELPVCEVQRRILVESSSTTYVVDKLCERGLVRRRPSSADRRVTLLALTPAGRRLIQQIFPPHAVAMRRAGGALPPREPGQGGRPRARPSPDAARSTRSALPAPRGVGARGSRETGSRDTPAPGRTARPAAPTALARVRPLGRPAAVCHPTARCPPPCPRRTSAGRARCPPRARWHRA